MAKQDPPLWADLSKTAVFRSLPPEAQQAAKERYFSDFWEREAQKAFADVGLPPELGPIVVRTESSGDPKAVSEAGAIGLTQLMPDTAAGLGVDPTDPAQNLLGGATYMKSLYDRYEGDLEQAVRAYHGGFDPAGYGPKTRAYTKKIMEEFGKVARSAEPTAETHQEGAPQLKWSDMIGTETFQSLPREVQEQVRMDLLLGTEGPLPLTTALTGAVSPETGLQEPQVKLGLPFPDKAGTPPITEQLFGRDPTELAAFSTSVPTDIQSRLAQTGEQLQSLFGRAPAETREKGRDEQPTGLAAFGTSGPTDIQRRLTETQERVAPAAPSAGESIVRPNVGRNGVQQTVDQLLALVGDREEPLVSGQPELPRETLERLPVGESIVRPRIGRNELSKETLGQLPTGEPALRTEQTLPAVRPSTGPKRRNGQSVSDEEAIRIMRENKWPIPEDPSRSPELDIALTLLQGVTGGGEQLLRALRGGPSPPSLTGQMGAAIGGHPSAQADDRAEVTPSPSPLAALGSSGPVGERDLEQIEQVPTQAIEALERLRKSYPSVFAPSRETKQDPVRRTLLEGLRTIPESLTAALPGMLAGGAIAGPMGSATGFFGGAGTVFGLAEYDRFLEMADKKGIPREISTNPAIKSALVEGVVESAGDALQLVTAGLLGPLAKGGKGVAKQGIRQLMQRGVGKTLGDVAKTAVTETGEEVVQAGLQAKIAKDIGLSEATPWEAIKEVLGPASVAGILFGGGATTIRGMRSRIAVESLADPTADPQTRKDVAQEAAKGIGRQSPTLATEWQNYADQRIDRNLPIDVEQPLGEFVEQQQQRANLLRDIIDIGVQQEFKRQAEGEADPIRQLKNLGYSDEQVAGMEPGEASAILREGRRADAPQEPAAEERPVTPPPPGPEARRTLTPQTIRKLEGLRYSKEQIDAITPQEAAEIVSQGRLAPEPQPEEAPVTAPPGVQPAVAETETAIGPQPTIPRTEEEPTDADAQQISETVPAFTAPEGGREIRARDTKGQEAPREGEAVETEAEIVPPPTPPAERKSDQQAIREFLRQGGIRSQQEAAGQAILDDLEEQGRSPQAVVQDFWERSYPNLPPEVQERFNRYITKVTGFQPGDVVATGPEGERITAESWQETYPPSETASEAQFLEGTERGLIALMEEANRRQAQPPPSRPAIEAPPEAEVVEAEEVERHDYATTQANLPPDIAPRVQEMGARIPDEDLAEDGREDEPHTTILYGLETDDVEVVRPLLANEPPIRVKLGKTSLFQNDEADVVKIDVESDELRRLHAKIKESVPNVETQPKYEPHVTVAYTRPGQGEKYAGMTDLEGQEITLDRVTFSDRAGNKTDIQLGGQAVAPEAPIVRPSTGRNAVTPPPAAQPREEAPTVPSALPLAEEQPSLPVSLNVARGVAAGRIPLLAPDREAMREALGSKEDVSNTRGMGQKELAQAYLDRFGGEVPLVQQPPAETAEAITPPPTPPTGAIEATVSAGTFQEGDRVIYLGERRRQLAPRQEYIVSGSVGNRVMIYDPANPQLRHGVRPSDLSAPQLPTEAPPVQPTPAETEPAPVQQPPAETQTAAPAVQQRDAPEQAPEWGATNKIVNSERARELEERMRAKFNQFNIGLDPELLAMGTELAVYHIEAGARQFGHFAGIMFRTFGDAALPYMRSWYMGARSWPEIDKTGMETSADLDPLTDADIRRLAQEAQAEPTPPTEEAPRGEEEITPTEQEAAAAEVIPPVAPERGAADRGERGRGARRAAADDVDVLEGVPPEDVGRAPEAAPEGARAARPGARREDVGERGAVRTGGATVAGREERGGEGVAPDGGRGGRGVGTGRGTEPTRRAEAGRGAEPEAGKTPSIGNYRITNPESLIAGGPKARFNKNKKAIETYQQVLDEGRDPSPEERDAIASYVGWGSLGQELFQGTWDAPSPKQGWEQENAWLREHVNQKEWESIQNSIINAHYTAPPVVQAMWDMAERMGFTGGRVLEPGMGVGNFFGLMPPDLMTKSTLTGIELDTVTGGMAKMLYPDANIQIKGYQESKTADNFYDLAIGNWPFAAEGPADRRYNHLNPSLHDYFFLKALDQVRPGGIVMGITSKGTMDRKGKAVRMHLAKRADLVAAYRFPTGTFQEYAGTKVVTDLVILQKRSDVRQDVDDVGWLESQDIVADTGDTITVNEYWTQHDDHVLGHMTYGSGTTTGTPGMIVEPRPDFDQQLEQLPSRVPEAIVTERPQSNVVTYVTNNTQDRQQSVTLQDNTLYVVKGEHLAPLHEVFKYQIKDKKETARREEQLRSLVELRRQYGALIDAERAGDTQTEELRTKLRQSYESFVEKHGPVRDSKGLSILKKVGDPFYPSLAALERQTDEGWAPAAILSRPTMRQKRELDQPSVRDAFVLERNANLTIDPKKIAERANTTEEAVIQELTEAGALFRTPDGTYEVADVYLSGNVRRKLREAEDAQAQGQDMQRNIDALTKVQPKDLPYFKIEAKMGAQWVGPGFYEEFVAHLLGVSNTADITVRNQLGRWQVRFTDRSYNDRPEATTTWGIEHQPGETRLPFDAMLEKAMNNTTAKIRYKDADDNWVTSEQRTDLANEKISLIREEFSSWVWGDPERRVVLEGDYNEVMNNKSSATFDGSFLTFEGMALEKGDQPFNLREHQINAIWRGLVNRKGLYGHAVGTGKSYLLSGLAVESRRFGIASKPLIFAHNANSRAVANEINTMYPAARVLYVDNLSPKTLPVTMRQIANDDWDAIVVPHSLIGKFGLTEETLDRMTAEEIAALEDAAIEAAAEADISLTPEMMDDEKAMKQVRNATAKELVHARNRIRERIAKIVQQATEENAIPFEELGVDMVMVDECFPYDTLVLTDWGWLKIGEIVENKLPVKLLTLNLLTHVLEWKPVTQYFKRTRTGSLVRVIHEHGEFVCTPTHKVWTQEHGYVRAGELTHECTIQTLSDLPKNLYSYRPGQTGKKPEILLAEVYSQGARDGRDEDAGVSSLSKAIHVSVERTSQRCQTEVLFRPLRNALSVQSARVEGILAREDGGNVSELSFERQAKSLDCRTDEDVESDAQPCNCREDAPSYAGAEICGTRREWNADRTSEDTRFSIGMDDGVRDKDGCCQRPVPFHTELLQGGYCRPGTEDCNRGGRQDAPSQETKNDRPTQDQSLTSARVVRVEVLERGREEQSSGSPLDDTRLYDIEVANNHNYFAQGVLVSNSHEFRKLPVSTSMKMKGLNVSPSDKSLSLQFLTDYVKSLNNGTGVHLFTGTPIVNTLNEIYNMQRYVADHEMARDGVKDWNGWFGAFADATTDIERTAAAEYEPVTRLASFVNVADLRRMIGDYTDIVFTEDMPEFVPRQTATGKELSDPTLTAEERDELLNGRNANPNGVPYKKTINDVAPMTQEQRGILARLQDLAREFRNASGKERREMIQSGHPANPAIMETNAANAGVDARLYDVTITEDDPNSKVNRAMRNVVRHYHDETDSSQVIFLERGFEDYSTRTRTRPDGTKIRERVPRFNLVKDMIDKLVAEGIPRNEIAVVSGKMNKDKRQQTADAMNNGKIRVVIGNTKTLGIGVNMQRHLRAIHHLDAPWTPGELEQRNGRGHRQGNEWNTILEYRYITDQIDARRWQVLAVKARFIKEFLTADEDLRVIEGDAASMAEGEGVGDIMETLSEATGDPRILMREKLKKDVEKLEKKERFHTIAIAEARQRVRELKANIERVGKRYRNLLADVEQTTAQRDAPFSMNVQGETYDERKAANDAVGRAVKGLSASTNWKPLGEIHGFPVQIRWVGEPFETEVRIMGRETHHAKPSIASIEAILRNIQGEVNRTESYLEEYRQGLARLESIEEEPFARQADLDKKRAMFAQVENDLQANPVPPPIWLRQGAPEQSEVYVGGQRYIVEGHQYHDEGYFLLVESPDGTFRVSYDRVTDEFGMPVYDPHPFEAPVRPPPRASTEPLQEGDTVVDVGGNSWGVMSAPYDDDGIQRVQVTNLRSGKLTDLPVDMLTKEEIARPGGGLQFPDLPVTAQESMPGYDVGGFATTDVTAPEALAEPVERMEERRPPRGPGGPPTAPPAPLPSRPVQQPPAETQTAEPPERMAEAAVPPAPPVQYFDTSKPGFQPATTKEGKDLVFRRDVLYRKLSEAITAPVRHGLRRQKRSVLGMFRPTPKDIFIRIRNDIRALSHEMGHYLERTLFGTNKQGRANAKRWLRSHEKELMKLAETHEKPSVKEGWAELLSLFALNRAQAQKQAPKVTAELERLLQERDPQFLGLLNEGEAKNQAWRSQSLRDKIEGHIQREPEHNGYTLGEVLHNLETGFINDLHPIGRASEWAEKLASTYRGWSAKAVHMALFDGIPNFHTRLPQGKSFHEVLTPLTAITIDPKTETLAPLGQIPAIIRRFEGYGVLRRLQELKARADAATKERPDRGAVNQMRAMRRVFEIGEDADIDAEVAAVEKQYPEFKEVFDDVQAWNRQLLDYMVDAGRLSPAGRIRIEELNKSYMPFYRAFSELETSMPTSGGQSFANVPNAIKRMHGSGRAFLPPLEGFLKNATMMISAAERNAVGIELAKVADQGGVDTSQWIWPMPAPVKVTKVHLDRLRKDLEEAGISRDMLEEADLERVALLFGAENYLIPEGQENKEVIIFRDGMPQRYGTEERLGKALNAVDRHEMNWVQKFLSIIERQLSPTLPDSSLLPPFLRDRKINLAKPAALALIGPRRAQQLTATALNPEFQIANPQRDIPAKAALTYKGGWLGGPAHLAHTYADFVVGLKEALGHGPWWDAWERAGGSMSLMSQLHQDDRQTTLEQVLKGDRYAFSPMNPFHWLMRIGQATEEAGRLTLTKRRLEEHGVTDPRAAIPKTQFVEAGYAGRRNPVDFLQRGAWTQSASMLSAFWNVGVQDLARIRDAFKENPRPFIAFGITTLTIPSLMLAALQHDHEPYRNEPQWKKDTYWTIFPAAMPGIFGEGWHPELKFVYRKPFTIGTIFSSVPERIVDSLMGYGWDPWQTIGSIIMQTFVPFPTALLPWWENAMNWNTFLDRPIETPYEEQKLPEYRFSGGTREIAKDLSRLLSNLPESMRVSPKKIDNVLHSYFTSFYRAADVSYAETKRTIQEVSGVAPPGGEPPTTRLSDIPISRALVQAGPELSSEPVDRFYEFWKKAREVHTTYQSERKNLNNEETRRIEQRYGTPLKHYDILKPFAEDMGRLNRERQDIEDNPVISGADKRRRLDKRTRDRNRTAIKALRRIGEWPKKEKKEQVPVTAPPRPPVTAPPAPPPQIELR